MEDKDAGADGSGSEVDFMGVAFAKVAPAEHQEGGGDAAGGDQRALVAAGQPPSQPPSAHHFLIRFCMFSSGARNGFLITSQ